MARAAVRNVPRVTDVIRKYGRCLELVAIDPHFHDITIGLYVKEGVATVWTFSGRKGAPERVRQVRDLLVARGGMTALKNAHDQARFDCGEVHERPLAFLIRNCVEKSPDLEQPSGPISVRDFRTKLVLTAAPRTRDGGWSYEVTSEGEDAHPEMRVRAVVGGLMRYGGMKRPAPSEAAFECGARHDGLVRLLLPSARNVSSVEEMLEAEAMRGQMTTSTLGFSSSP